MKRITPDTIGYINAGGRGTRLNGIFTPDRQTGIAKALLAIGEPPIRLIDHHIANLQQQGVEDIVIGAGDQEGVYEYIQDTYVAEDGVVATSSVAQLGTGGDLINYVRESNFDKNVDVVIQNVDTVLDISIGDFIDEFNFNKALGAVAGIALTLNRGVPNQDAYAVASTGAVLRSEEFSSPGLSLRDEVKYDYRGSSTGAVILKTDFLKQNRWTEDDGQLSLYRHILADAWGIDGLFAYNNGQKFFRDVGTVATWLASQDNTELQSYLRYN